MKYSFYNSNDKNSTIYHKDFTYNKDKEKSNWDNILN
jgi:hypothetical protein